MRYANKPTWITLSYPSSPTSSSGFIFLPSDYMQSWNSDQDNTFSTKYNYKSYKCAVWSEVVEWILRHFSTFQKSHKIENNEVVRNASRYLVKGFPLLFARLWPFFKVFGTSLKRPKVRLRQPTKITWSKANMKS